MKLGRRWTYTVVGCTNAIGRFEMIDWNGKLEAVHTDGRVMPILSVKGPDFEGDYAVSPAPDGRDCFRADGSKWMGEITGYDTGWTIRNTPVATPTPDERAVAPELAKHMLDSWEAMAKVDPKDVGPHFAANWIETAKGIVAEAENPDITEVRSLLEGMHGASDEDIALAALVRGRQLEKEGK